MVKKKPDQGDSFKSIQIISSKAHQLWEKAKAMKEKTSKHEPGEALPESAGSDKEADLVVAISLSNLVKATLLIALIIIGGWVLFTIRDKLLVLILAFFVSIVIDASVRFLEERVGLPRSISVLLVYFVALALLVFLVASLVPIVATQLQDIAQNVNQSADAFLADPKVSLPFVSDGFNQNLSIMLGRMLETLQVKDRASALFQFGESLSFAAQTSFSWAVNLAGSVVNFVATLVIILFMTFFIQMEKEKISHYLRIFFPRPYRHYVDTKADAVYHKMSQWAQGQLILCFAIGIIVFVALTILGMPYALTLAILAGFTEFIPYAGPLIAAVPAVLIAFSHGGLAWGLIVVVVYYVIQFCENNLLIPLIMRHAVGLSPILVIFSMLVGISFPSTIHPILGIILSVPVTTIIMIFIDDLYQYRKRK